SNVRSVPRVLCRSTLIVDFDWIRDGPGREESDTIREMGGGGEQSGISCSDDVVELIEDDSAD
ncbi:hypothetical protein PENTCL1PPCAC_23536, partial [Pristionchus entomophagus]